MASAALVAILNISNAAIDHKTHCADNCAVSLGGLKTAATLLLPQIHHDEIASAKRYIDAMPSY